MQGWWRCSKWGKRGREGFQALEAAPEVVWCFWTGDNDITPNRLEALRSMEESIGVPVRLVTPANLGEYIVEGAPLHPAYEFLSLVHRADYLRAYFMHHHGGGYSDIKRHTRSWVGAFRRLNRSKKWALGYREVGRRGVAMIGGEEERRLKKNWRKLIGIPAFIFRPHTPLTGEWYDEVWVRLDGFYDELRRNPGNVWGDNEGYPVPWTYILGNILHPLELKYHRRVIKDERVKPSFDNYR